MLFRRISTLPAIGILTAVYFIAGKLALKLASVHVSASPVWPAAGIALGALLVFGYRTWPGIFLGAFLLNLITAGNIATSLGIAAGNTLEVLCAAWLINRFAEGTAAFNRAGNVFKFSLAVIVTTLIGPLFGVTSLELGGFAQWNNFRAIWLTWWLGDVTGVLVVAPLVVLWLTSGTTRRWTRGEIVEVGLLFLTLLFLAEITFGGWFPITAKNYPISFLYGPFIVWLAFRFTPRETATGIFILTSMAIWGTMHKLGPFVLQTDNQSLLILQARTAVLAITAMALSAGMAERRRAEAVIEEQKASVEAANRTKDKFLAMLSHELRTPLTPVIAALEILQREPPPSEEFASTLAMMRRNIELEGQLIDDLLDLTRITKNKLQLKLHPLDVRQAISNAVEICRVDAEAKKQRLRINLGADNHHVMADVAKFQQIIWNLLKNAIKFTPDGGEIAITSSNPSPRTLAIEIKDTGIGIEPDVMKLIFDPFEQGDRSFQRRFGGLGLGLAIANSFAKAHDGALLAESEGRDRGTTFTFTLKTIAPLPESPKPAPVAPAPARALRILLVDDHEDTRGALQRLLVRLGHTVVARSDVHSALEIGTAQNDFDLLISDISLPDGNGMELMSKLRDTSKIRGIAISGFGSNGDIESSLNAGFAEHLVKPLKIEKLEAAIERVMS